jgi:hypothetical protein
LTRFEIDKRTDDELKKKERFGDPMRNIIAKKEKEMEMENMDFNSKDYYIGEDIFKIKERNFYLPICNFIGMSNRFNIKPG